MANLEQLQILKQGIEVWNRWRDENPGVEVDLSGADFREADLSNANLFGSDLSGVRLSRSKLRKTDLRKANLFESKLNDAELVEADLHEAKLIRANLNGAYLMEANLHGANLFEADLSEADFSDADLSEADLSEANLSEAYLIRANLSGADLNEADLSGADLNEADLSGADLRRTNLRRTNLSGTDLSSATFGDVNFAQIDLNQTHGLESIYHNSPSAISTDTLLLSSGEIPEVFLRGCGFSDWEIESAKLYKPGLSNQEIIDINYKIFDLRANRAIQISPLFISYSHGDTEFVDKLEPQFIEKGIRFWRDIHDMKSGRMEKQVDHAIRQNPTVILVLSKNSIHSDWVEYEASLARKLEKELDRDILCPVALDDSWKSAKWQARLMEQIVKYNILDYSKWKDNGEFGKVFNKMVAGLDMFYKA